MRSAFPILLFLGLTSCKLLGGLSQHTTVQRPTAPTTSAPKPTAPGQKLTPEQYIASYKHFAVRSMKKKGVPASITLAQGLLESGNGNSWLARTANNHFGIKCASDWKGPSVRKDDDTKDECFRKYASVEHSYDDHGDFLRGRKWYAPLFQLRITDYKGWAHGLKKAGYATDPAYPQKLISLIERYQLQQYDRQ